MSRWQPPHPDLRRIRIAVQGRLTAAALRHEIPGQTTYSPRRDDVKYQVTVYRELRTGVISAGVRIEDFERLAGEPGDDSAVIRWMLGPGRELVADVDRIVDRGVWRPAPLGGRTLLMAELGAGELDSPAYSRR